MAIVSDIEIRLRADIARLQQDMTRARQSVSSFTSDAKNLLKGFAAGFSIAAVVSQVIGAQREFDKLHSSLVTATGSVKNAGQAFDALQKLAATTPFSLQEVTEGFLKLRNLGLTPSERAIISYGNTASAMGKNLNQMVEAVADAATGEFERLKEFGVKAKQQGDKVSLTFQGTTKSIGNNAAEIEAYLMAIGETQFAGGMERQAATLDGALSNLSDTWSQTLTSFSQSGFGDVVFGSVLALTGALSDLGAMFKAVRGAAEDEGGKVAEIAPLHKALAAIFETVTVLGINVAYVFKTIGKDLGAFAAQAVSLFNGGMKGLMDGSTLKAVQAIGNARVEESKRERAEVDATSARVLQAATKNQAAQAEEAAARAKGTTDALAQYKIKAEASKQLTDAQKKELQAYQALTVEAEKQLAATARQAAGQDSLNAGQKLDADLTDDIRLKKVKLNKEQEETLRGLYAQISANAEAVESQKRYKEMQEHQAEAERKLRDERAQVIQSAEDEAKSNEELVRTFGMTTAAIAALEVARLKEQLAQRQGGAFTLDEIEQLEKVIALKERSAKALADVEQLEQVRGFWTSIEKTAHDTFVSIANGGADTWKRLKDTAKNIFFEWLYQMTLKKWIVNVGVQADGAGAVSGITNALGNAAGGSAGGGILSTLGSLYGALSGGMTLGGGLGSGFMGSLAGGLNGAGVGSGLTSALGLNIGNSIAGVVGPQVAGAVSSGLGAIATAMPYAAAAVAGYYLSKAIAGDKKINGIGTALNYVGVVGGLANRAFGMGPKEYSDNRTLSGTLNGNGTLSADMLAAWKQEGGWFRSNKSGTDKQPVDAQLAAGLVSTYQAIKDSTAQYATVLGANADAIANRAQALNIAFTKDEAANQKAIADFFTGVADNVAREVLPDLAGFQAAGESAAQTLQRLAVNAIGMDQILAAMNTTSQEMFGAVGTASIAARERLLQFAGGLDTLASQTAFYQQNILTEADRAMALQKPVADALATLGFAGLTTTEQLKAAVDGLVSSGKVATEEGAKQYAGLMALAPQFKTVADYLKDVSDTAAQTAKDAADKAARIASERAGMEIQVMQLQGDAAGALKAQRDLELAAMDESLRPLQQRIHALQDEKTAAQAAVDTLRDTAGTAFEALQRAVNGRKKDLQTSFDQVMAGFQASIAAATTRVPDLQALSTALKNSGLPGTTSDRSTAQAQLAAAVALARAGGILPSADQVQSMLSALGGDTTDQFATLVDYQRDQLRTANSVMELSGLTDNQLSVAQQTLNTLNSQKDIAQATYNAEVAQLDNILAAAQRQIDAINGVDTSVLSVAVAFGDFATAIRAALGNGTIGGQRTVTAETQVEALYQSIMGRVADAGGLKFYADNMRAGRATADDVARALRDSGEYRAQHPPVAVDTGVQYGTMSRTSTDQPAINAQMQASMERTATAVEQLASQFNQVSSGGNSLITEPA